MRKSFHKRIKNTGFTLVEMMVAVAVFSLVMVVAMSALINVIDANLKAQALKTAINNVHFALEGISKDMRMGSGYECIGIADCSDGATGIKYKSPRAFPGGYAYYEFKAGQIWSCLDKSAITCNSNTIDSAITSEDVTITNMTFYVINGTGLQPRVVITLSGEAGKKDKIKTEFDLQTSVSQRVRE
ncbi:MAG: type II secretion system protein [Candidatus Paceibacterota bacterium]